MSSFPKRSEWRLVSKNANVVFDFEAIQYAIETLFAKHKPIFVTITPNRREIRLSLSGHLKKAYLEKIIDNYSFSNTLELHGVMEKDKLVSDEEAYNYCAKQWPHDTQPEGFEDSRLSEEESLRIRKAVDGKFDNIYTGWDGFLNSKILKLICYT